MRWKALRLRARVFLATNQSSSGPHEIGPGNQSFLKDVAPTSRVGWGLKVGGMPRSAPGAIRAGSGSDGCLPTPSERRPRAGGDQPVRGDVASRQHRPQNGNNRTVRHGPATFAPQFDSTCGLPTFEGAECNEYVQVDQTGSHRGGAPVVVRCI